MWEKVVWDFKTPYEINIDLIKPSKKYTKMVTEAEETKIIDQNIEEENFQKMKFLKDLDIPDYEVCFDEYWTFVDQANSLEKTNLRKFLYTDPFLLDLEEKYVQKYEYDKFDVISLIGYQLFKINEKKEF